MSFDPPCQNNEVCFITGLEYEKALLDHNALIEGKLQKIESTGVQNMNNIKYIGHNETIPQNDPTIAQLRTYSDCLDANTE